MLEFRRSPSSRIGEIGDRAGPFELLHVHGIGDEALGSFGASSKMNNEWLVPAASARDRTPSARPLARGEPCSGRQPLDGRPLRPCSAPMGKLDSKSRVLTGLEANHHEAMVADLKPLGDTMHWLLIVISVLFVMAAAAVADPDVVPETAKPPNVVQSSPPSASVAAKKPQPPPADSRVGYDVAGRDAQDQRHTVQAVLAGLGRRHAHDEEGIGIGPAGGWWTRASSSWPSRGGSNSQLRPARRAGRFGRLASCRAVDLRCASRSSADCSRLAGG